MTKTTHLLITGLIGFAIPFISQATLTPGATLNYDAALDTPGDNLWENNGSEAGWAFELTDNSTANNLINRTPTAVSDANLQSLSQAYNTPAGRFRNQGNTGVAAFSSLPGALSSKDASFEIVLQLQDLNDNHLFFESGGNGNGTALSLRGTTVFMRPQQHNQTPQRNAEVSFDLTPADTGHFIQVVGVIDVVNDMSHLYLNGQLMASAGTFVSTNAAATADLTQWDGGDQAALGRFNTAGGVAGGNQAYADLDADVAIFRFYGDQALSAGEVQANYEFLQIPEPGTPALLATGVLTACLLRRRRRNARIQNARELTLHLHSMTAE